MSEGDQHREHRDAESRLPGGPGRADRLRLVLLVALGGAAGAVARYGLGGWVQGLAGAEFPWGTLVVNVVGSFLLGTSLGAFQAVALPTDTRALVAVGFLGAFTTFSTFSHEAVTLFGDGEWVRGTSYLAGSVGAGLVAVVAGAWLATVAFRAYAGPG